MRRWVFLFLALGASVGAGWLRHQSSASSFGAYSNAQLGTLEAGYRAAMKTAPTGVNGARDRGLQRMEAALSLELLEAERSRRHLFLAALAVVLLGALGAVLPGRGGSPASRGEERRLASALGDPARLLEGERHKAARLLGVSLDAPPAVVDAALSAQLAAHDLGRMDGLAPDLRRIVLDQRQALQRARDLLVTGSAATAGRG